MSLGKFSATTVYLEHFTTALNCLTPFGGNTSSNGAGANGKDGNGDFGVATTAPGSSGVNRNDDVMVFIDKDGLSFARNYGSTNRIQLLLSRDLFVSYSFANNKGKVLKNPKEIMDKNEREVGESGDDEDDEDVIQLCIKLNHLLDTVNVTNRNKDDAIECSMHYDGLGSEFVLTLEDSFVEEEVQFSTFLYNESLWNKEAESLQLQKELLLFECIFNGDIIFNTLNDLKELGANDCYFYVKSSDSLDSDNIFAMIAKSELGYSKIILPNSRNIMEKMEVYDPDGEDGPTITYNSPVIAYFDFARLDMIRPSAKIASKILIRLDSNGMLSFNILSQTDNVIISNRDDKSTGQSQSGVEYPGIVIEITTLTKELLNDSSKQDIEDLMQVTLRNRKHKHGYNGSNNPSINKKRPKPNDIGGPTDNLLRLSGIVSNKDNNDDDGDDSSSLDLGNSDTDTKQFNTREIPFF